MLKNIKGILFDADDTIIDHKECEKQALKYLFKNIEFEYKDEYQEIFRPLDRKLWDDVAFNRTSLKKEDIPEYCKSKYGRLCKCRRNIKSKFEK